jgi:MFS family permease
VEEMTVNLKDSKKDRPILYWGISAFFCLYEVILRVSPSGMTKTLMDDFSLTCTDLGLLIGSYYWAYTFLQVPCGFFADKIGTRKVIGISALICAIGTLIFSHTDQLYIAIFGRALIGVGSAAGFITSLKVAADWFPKAQFPFFAALTNMMSTIGGNFAGKPLTLLMEAYHWKLIYQILALLGIVIAFLSFFFIKDKHVDSKISFNQTKQQFLSIIKDSQIWLAGIIGGVCYLPITAIAELWGTPFLMNTFAIKNADASLSTNLIFIGTAIGSPVFALLARFLNSQKIPLQIVSIVSFVCLLLFTYAHMFSLFTIWVTLFILGFVIGGQILVFSIVKERVPLDISATALGFINTLISLFGIIFQPFLGFLLDFFWEGTIALNGTRLYSSHAYHCAMYILPLMMLVTIIGVQRLKEK